MMAGKAGHVGDRLAEALDLAAALDENQRLRDDLAAAGERERILAKELQHRVRNMVATIRSIHRQSLASGTEHDEFAHHFQGRLDAIARNQTYPGGVRSGGIEIEDIVRDELLQVLCREGPRCTIAGPPVMLRDKAAEMMGLAIHELATNAVKFGALAQEGRLAVEWSLDGEVLRFRWSETGVAVATVAPRPRRFGRQVIEEALPYQLGATTLFELRPGGVECVIELPLPRGAINRPVPSDNDGDGSPPLPNGPGDLS